MPGSMNGIGLAHVIRLERPYKTILASPLGGVHHDAFFSKPYNTPAIITRLKVLLGGPRKSCNDFSRFTNFLTWISSNRLSRISMM